MKIATDNTGRHLLWRIEPESYVQGRLENGNTSMNDRDRVIEALAKSRIFREFTSAFHETTGVRLCLESVDSGSNGLCQKRTSEFGPGQSQAKEPFGITILTSGLYKVLVPVRHGAQLVGVIRTGLILERPMDGDSSLSKIPVIPRNRSKSLVNLIALFAEHLGLISNQLVLQQENCEPAFILKAKQYIQTHRGEDLRLAEVAQQAHVSSYHLCKMFKKITGINFSNYVARLRIEMAKELLLKRTLKINDIASEAGFHSLTQFNKVFKRFIGESPRIYRERLNALAKPRDF